MNQQPNSLVFHEDGTVTDSNTGLMWMLPLVGQGWTNGVPQDYGVTLSWDTATSQYGRARNINATSMNCIWGGSSDGTAYHRKYPLSQETYSEYKFGNKSHEFAGYSDWRLPTVEEFWSLSQAGIEGTLLVKAPHLNQAWTANPSTKSLKSLIAALDMMHSAWMFELSGHNGFGDTPMGHSHAVRLVRAGNIFQAFF